VLHLLVALAVWAGRGSGACHSGAALVLIGLIFDGRGGAHAVGRTVLAWRTTGLSLGGWWP